MSCYNPFMVDNPLFPARSDRRKIPVPCGKCPPCRKRHSSGWAFRLIQHDKVADTSVMLTLTYDTEHVPISSNGFMTADRKAFPAFMKRLRKALFGSQAGNLKYYAVIEYGSKRARPHYHAILFNLPDLTWQTDVNGNEIGFSPSVSSSWTFGGVDIRPCSGATVGYVCKYLHKGKSVPMHRNDDRVPERSFMSKGLGESYITDAKIRYHTADLERNYVVQDGFKKAMPRYYRNKIFTDEKQRVEQAVHFEQLSADAFSDAKRAYLLRTAHNPDALPFEESVRQMRKSDSANFIKRAKESRSDL